MDHSGYQAPKPPEPDGVGGALAATDLSDCAQPTSPSGGPSATFTACIPDLDHYSGRGGRAFPLWADAAATKPNVHAGVLAKLTDLYETPISAEDFMAYIAAIIAHPAYVMHFTADLLQPGLRIPLTADATLFCEAVALGCEVIWLHTFGERFISPRDGRPAGAPRGS